MGKLWPKAEEYIEQGKTFEEYNTEWHRVCAQMEPIPPKDSMYWDGQFDEFPYAEWQEAGGISGETRNRRV